MKPDKPRKTPTGDYEVGYARPPQHSQFKPGNPGNPNGRRKAQPTLQEIVLRDAARSVRIQVGDKIETVANIESIVRRLGKEARSGDQRARRLYIDLYLRLGSPNDAAVADDYLKAADMEIPDDDVVRRMLSRFHHLRSE